MSSTARDAMARLGFDAGIAEPTIPWCGPLLQTDGGIEVTGAFFSSEDERVVMMPTWRGELYFADADVDPLAAQLSYRVLSVRIPARIGPFHAHSTGLAMSAAPAPALACLATPARSSRRVVIPSRWKFYWRPTKADDWVFCGPIN